MFVMSPTRMAEVQACTSAGVKMPQKSTDFYPKIISVWRLCSRSG